MQTAARTVGGPGAGKTTRALQIVEKCLETVIGNPFKIGFVSFTRAARQEASNRAGDKFGVKGAELEKQGWFRTLHSCCYKLTGIQPGELLLGTATDNEWLKGVLGDPGAKIASLSLDEDYLTSSISNSVSAKALALWDAARNRLCTLEKIWEAAAAVEQHMPSLGQCEEVVTLYEEGKTKDCRIDFCDMLMRYVGKDFSGLHEMPYMDVEPQGEIPDLPVWLHDEAQDMSALTALVFRRISSTAKYLYLFGDDWQSIYGWSGTDGSIFANWPVAKEEILPISYRCKSEILKKADELIHRSYKPRPFRSEQSGGQVDEACLTDVLQEIKPGQDVLVLARTNEYAREAAQYLDGNLLPWKPIKGGGGFAAPVRAEGVKALIDLRCGLGVTGEAIHRMMQLLPVKVNGETLLERGWKTKFDDKEFREGVGKVDLRSLDAIGATETLRHAIDLGGVQEILEPPAARMYAAGMMHGVEAMGKPTIRCGTLHAAKGLECDHCILYNRLPFPTQRAILEEENLHEERRCWYVGLTRARERTTIACNFGEPFSEL